MTCLVAVKNKQKDGTIRITMGSDRGIFMESEANEIVEYHLSTTPKIWKRSFNNGKNDMLIGAAGNSTGCDDIEDLDFSKIKLTKKYQDNAALFMREKIIPLIRAKFNGLESPELLIAILDHVFYIDSAMAVIDTPSYGYSVGSASLPARAALMTIEKLNKTGKMKPISIVKLALQIAESCSVTCKSPFDYLEI